MTRTDELVWRRPTENDHGRIVPSLNAWWGGRDMAALLPRLFFQHFTGTSVVVDAPDGSVAGFVVAFVSQDDPSRGYIHFVGVAPDRRATGLGRELYRRTFATLAEQGCTRVKAVTSPVNTGSIAFHTRMGFRRLPPPGTDTAATARAARAAGDDTPRSARDDAWPDYDGAGEPRVVFCRDL